MKKIALLSLMAVLLVGCSKQAAPDTTQYEESSGFPFEPVSSAETSPETSPEASAADETSDLFDDEAPIE